MHHSRLAGFIIDCRLDQSPEALSGAATFWSTALGMPVLGENGPGYLELDASARDLHVEVQAVTHESRVHLDIQSDDVEAEVVRLEGLGARRVGKVQTWWVMEAPTGQRFCVVEAHGPLAGQPGARAWP